MLLSFSFTKYSPQSSSLTNYSHCKFSSSYRGKPLARYIYITNDFTNARRFCQITTEHLQWYRLCILTFTMVLLTCITWRVLLRFFSCESPLSKTTRNMLLLRFWRCMPNNWQALFFSFEILDRLDMIQTTYGGVIV